jgi:hypothetical protein
MGKDYSGYKIHLQSNKIYQEHQTQQYKPPRKAELTLSAKIEFETENA